MFDPYRDPITEPENPIIDWIPRDGFMSIFEAMTQLYLKGHLWCANFHLFKSRGYVMAPRDIAPHHSSERQQGPWHTYGGLCPRLSPENKPEKPIHPILHPWTGWSRMAQVKKKTTCFEQVVSHSHVLVWVWIFLFILTWVTKNTSYFPLNPGCLIWILISWLMK